MSRMNGATRSALVGQRKFGEAIIRPYALLKCDFRCAADLLRLRILSTVMNVLILPISCRW